MLTFNVAWANVVGPGVLILLLHMCLHTTTTYVSSYYYICVLILLLHMCPHNTTTYVSSYTTISSYYYTRYALQPCRWHLKTAGSMRHTQSTAPQRPHTRPLFPPWRPLFPPWRLFWDSAWPRTRAMHRHSQQQVLSLLSLLAFSSTKLCSKCSVYWLY
jgi:hypothetical protein